MNLRQVTLHQWVTRSLGLLMICFSCSDCVGPPVPTRVRPHLPGIQGQEIVRDDEISSVISSKFATDPFLSEKEVTVKTQGGIVILSGTVENLFERERALLISKPIRGVRTVIDLLRTKPAKKSDKKIQIEIVRAFHLDPAIDAEKLYVRVEDGVVNLYGSVGSLTESSLAARAVSRIEGVREVRNKLTVIFDVTRSDTEVYEDVLGRLRDDPWVPEHQLILQVRAGYVFLRGTVGSLVAKERVENNARVMGVDWVDSRQIIVVYDPLDRLLEMDSFRPLDNDQVKEVIVDAINLDPRLKGGSIEVSVQSGVVTLRGSVPTVAARRSVRAIAENSDGVVEVLDYLNVSNS